VREQGANVLSVPGVYEVLSEHFNNDVLDEWAERNPDKAYPEERWPDIVRKKLLEQYEKGDK